MCESSAEASDKRSSKQSLNKTSAVKPPTWNSCQPPFLMSLITLKRKLNGVAKLPECKDDLQDSQATNKL